MQIIKNESEQHSQGDGDQIMTATEWGPIKPEELVRLSLQLLQDLGYQQVAGILEKESGISLESATATEFRDAILHGRWPHAESLLGNLVNLENIDRAKFLIREQKFLELLDERRTMKALHILRTELTPLQLHMDRLHELSSLVLCTSIDDVRFQAGWAGSGKESRGRLLEKLQEYIMPWTMIPRQRWNTLLHQALSWQRRNCIYHPHPDGLNSLMTDHVCTRPSYVTMATLQDHTDEVWDVSYSNTGKYLASVSKDQTCIVWNAKTFQKVHTLKIKGESMYCTWSPDDTHLLIHGSECQLQLWNAETGTLVGLVGGPNDQIRSCAWLPCGTKFFAGSCKGSITLWSIKGTEIYKKLTPPVLGLQLSEDGKRLVAFCYEGPVSIYAVGNELQDEYHIQEPGTITSLSITRDGRQALVNIKESQEIHLWDLDRVQLLHQYHGHKQKLWEIHSIFGGRSESLVISGSEDNAVYMWNRENPMAMIVIEGHEKPVNSLSWKPGNPSVFASASDDRTIRIWNDSTVT